MPMMPRMETVRPGRLRLRACLAVLLALALPMTASGFLDQYSLEDGVVSLTFDVGEAPQWEFEDPDGNDYEGFLDHAEFSGTFGLILKDRDRIRRNGLPVEAELSGRIGRECDNPKITLKDKTNNRKFVLRFIDGGSQTCSANG